jgi:hypothetical protein
MNIVEAGRPQMTIRRMRIACWIPMATNAHTVCDTYCFPLQQLLYELASLLHYTCKFNTTLFYLSINAATGFGLNCLPKRRSINEEIKGVVQPVDVTFKMCYSCTENVQR